MGLKSHYYECPNCHLKSMAGPLAGQITTCHSCGSEVYEIDRAQYLEEPEARHGHGQRWEPCPKCNAEPVCNDCGYCDRHCKCADDAEARRLAREIEREEPGFWRRLTEHLEQGAQER
jgi:hypothetical protein